MRGFTLIEVLVVLTVTTLVMTALSGLTVSMYRSHAQVVRQNAATFEARRGIEEITRAVRGASYGLSGEGPLVMAETDLLSLVFDHDKDGSLDRVTYRLTETTLMREVSRHGTEQEVSISLIRNATTTAATPFFTYLDRDGVTLPTPVDTTRVARVHITASLLVDPVQNTTFTLVGDATLRNPRP